MLKSIFGKKKYLPDAYYKNINEIDWEAIKMLGYRLILVDADNTIIIHGNREKTPFSKTALTRIADAGLKMAILSNASAKRAEALGLALGVDAVGMANKPGAKGIHRASEKYDVPVEQIILVGDQYFTDMLAGRNAGCRTILVDPLTDDEPWYIKLKRWQEGRVYRCLDRKSYYDKLPDVSTV